MPIATRVCGNCIWFYLSAEYGGYESDRNNGKCTCRLGKKSVGDQYFPTVRKNTLACEHFRTSRDD